MSPKPRILLCGTGQTGVGQTVRLTRIARQLRRAFGTHADLIVATGIPEAHSFFSSDSYELTELAAPKEFTVWGGGRELTSASQMQRQVLADELETLISNWAPDVFVTPHYGGLAGELSLVYPILRRVRIVLVLRDFYDSDGFVDTALLEASLRDYVDQVIVFAPEYATGGLPQVITHQELAPLCYVGYVPPPSVQGPGERVASESNRITVHCQVGGGADGAALLGAAVDATLEANRSGCPVTLRATTGPFAANELDEARRRLKRAGVIERWRFRDELTRQPWSDLRISMAGYNSCVEALWDGANTLVFPRLRQEDREQATRARFFETHFGAVQTAEAESQTQMAKSILKAIFERRSTYRRIPPDAFVDHLTVARRIAGDAFDVLLERS